MGVPSYLIQKQDTYYFRQACNQFLKFKLGKREIIKSLGVTEKSIAIRMSREVKIRVDSLVDHLKRNDTITTDFARNYIDNCIVSIKNKYKGGINNNPPDITPTLVLPPCPTPTSLPKVTEFPTSKQVTIEIQEQQPIKPLFEKFCDEKVKLQQWSPKTYRERSAHICVILDLLSYIKTKKDLNIEDITKKDVRSLKDLLLLLPKNHNKKFKNISLSGLMDKCLRIEEGNHTGISAKTLVNLQEKISLNTLVDKYVSTIKAFWKWLIQLDYLENNVFEILTYNYKKTTTSWKSYTSKDLNILFNDKIYNEREYLYPYQYYVPIIALYSSCRLQEICQLRTHDIDSIDNIHIINVVNDHNTSLKTECSERAIPIHDDLVASGFIDHVTHLNAKGEKYIFPELKNDEDKTSIKRVSKWFNERYRTNKGFGKGYSFHSLRRTFINEMSRNGANDSDIRQIIGHKPLKTDTLNKHYKDELSVHEKHELIMNHIKYDSCTFPWRK